MRPGVDGRPVLVRGTDDGRSSPGGYRLAEVKNSKEQQQEEDLVRPAPGRMV